MKRYKVNVNGTAYEIEIEELSSAQIKAASTHPTQATATASTPAPTAQDTAPSPAPSSAASTVSGGGEQVVSPMPGTILSIDIKEGQAVKAGDVLMILEAMKMENEIMCPRDGTVISINTTKGASVESGTLLCVIG